MLVEVIPFAALGAKNLEILIDLLLRGTCISACGAGFSWLRIDDSE